MNPRDKDLMWYMHLLSQSDKYTFELTDTVMRVSRKDRSSLIFQDADRFLSWAKEAL